MDILLEPDSELRLEDLQHLVKVSLADYLKKNDYRYSGLDMDDWHLHLSLSSTVHFIKQIGPAKKTRNDTNFA